MTTPFTIASILKSPCAARNPHLQTEVKKKRPKYGNEIVEFDGKTFHSIKERNRYITNRARQTSGEICDLELQVDFVLESEGKKICTYIADSVYRIVKTGETVVEDVKSPATRRLAPYRLKKKLMAANYKIEIKEV